MYKSCEDKIINMWIELYIFFSQIWFNRIWD